MWASYIWSNVSAPILRWYAFSFEKAIDGIEVGGVWRQVKEPASYIAQSRSRCFVVVDGQVVANDDNFGLQLWSGNASDIDLKGLTIHRALDNPRRDQMVVCQNNDECLRSPCAKRDIHFQAFSA